MTVRRENTLDSGHERRDPCKELLHVALGDYPRVFIAELVTKAPAAVKIASIRRSFGCRQG